MIDGREKSAWRIWQARIMHRFSSRSDESADLTRAGAPACGSEAPANVLYGTLRRPTECNAVGAHSTTDDFVDAVENLSIMRAKDKFPVVILV
jgi:hypothetical protein